jgi:hypothetical protein
MLECRRIKVLFDFFANRVGICEEILKNRGKWMDKDNQDYDESKNEEELKNSKLLDFFDDTIDKGVVRRGDLDYYFKYDINNEFKEFSELVRKVKFNSISIGERDSGVLNEYNKYQNSSLKDIEYNLKQSSQKEPEVINCGFYYCIDDKYYIDDNFMVNYWVWDKDGNNIYDREIIEGIDFTDFKILKFKNYCGYFYKNLLNRGIIFKNCKFNSVEFEGGNNVNFEFVNCVFLGKVKIIQDNTSENIQYNKYFDNKNKPNLENDKFLLESCMLSSIEIRGEKISNYIGSYKYNDICKYKYMCKCKDSYNCCYVDNYEDRDKDKCKSHLNCYVIAGDIEIKKSIFFNTKNNIVVIENLKYNRKFLLSDCENIFELRLKNVKAINGMKEINDVEKNSFCIEGCTFVGNKINKLENVICDKIEINGVKFNYGVEFSYNDLDFDNNKKLESVCLDIKDCESKYVIIYYKNNCYINCKINLSRGNKENIIEHFEIKKFKEDKDDYKNSIIDLLGKIEIKGDGLNRIGKLGLYNLNFKNEIKVLNMLIDFIAIENCGFWNILALNNIYKFDDKIIGLKEIERDLDYSFCKILNVKFDFNFLKSYKNEKEEKEQEIVDFIYYRETIVAMIQYLLKKGDLFLANELRAKSFELHDLILELKKNNLFSKERTVYYFNKYLAGFGANIWLPIGWMFGVSFLFTISMMICNDLIWQKIYYLSGESLKILPKKFYIMYYVKYFLLNFVPPLPESIVGFSVDEEYSNFRKEFNPSMFWNLPKIFSAFMWYLIYKCVRFRNGV